MAGSVSLQKPYKIHKICLQILIQRCRLHIFLSSNQKGDKFHISIWHTLVFFYTAAYEIRTKTTYMAGSVSLQNPYKIHKICLQILIQRCRLHIFLSSNQKGDKFHISSWHTLVFFYTTAYEIRPKTTYMAGSVSLQKPYKIRKICFQIPIQRCRLHIFLS